jgi:hypothetical protein
MEILLAKETLELWHSPDGASPHDRKAFFAKGSKSHEDYSAESNSD